MTLEEILENAREVANHMAHQYHQEPSDFLSYASVYIPGLLNRIDQTQKPTSQRAYVRKSLRGYFLHFMRDHASLIKTPRNQQPHAVSPVYENTKPADEVDTLPDWVVFCLSDKNYGKRFSNGYLRFLDS